MYGKNKKITLSLSLAKSKIFLDILLKIKIKAAPASGFVVAHKLFT